MCHKPDTPTATTPVFTIEKAKMAKDALDKKVSATNTPTTANPTLQFS